MRQEQDHNCSNIEGGENERQRHKNSDRAIRSRLMEYIMHNSRLSPFDLQDVIKKPQPFGIMFD